MPELIPLFLNQFTLFALILSRVSGLVMTAPIFGSRSVPMRIRGLLAVALSMLITPLYWGSPIDDPSNILQFLVLIGREAILGLTLGLGIMVLFSGVQVTGQIVSQMSGMGLAEIFDPGFDASVPIFSQLLDLLVLAVFVTIGGHRQVMAALLDTFRWTPPGSEITASKIVGAFGEVLHQSFLLGIRAAAPAIVALLMSVFVMGLISRTLPQLNVLAVGFSLNSIILLITLSISMGVVAWIFQEHVGPTIETLLDVFRAQPERLNRLRGGQDFPDS